MPRVKRERNKPYSTWKRRLDSGRCIYYVRFRRSDGGWSSAKSSGRTTRKAAEAWAIARIGGKEVEAAGGGVFASFSRGFFSPKGPYMKGLALRGRKVSDEHAGRMQGFVDKYLIPEFGDCDLGRIDEASVLAFGLELADKRLSPGTVERILRALKTILEEAFRQGLIRRLPRVEFEGPATVPRPSLINADEVVSLFVADWRDPAVKIVNLIAATTGMRLSDIKALRRKDVREDYLVVPADAGRPRYFPIPGPTRDAIAGWMARSPHKAATDLLFCGEGRDELIDDGAVEEGFDDALARIGIDEARRKERGLCFLSWRHHFNALRAMGYAYEDRYRLLVDRAEEAVFQNGRERAHNVRESLRRPAPRPFRPPPSSSAPASWAS